MIHLMPRYLLFILVTAAAILLGGGTLVLNRQTQPRPTHPPAPLPATPQPSNRASGGCFIGGCSNEICTDRKDVVSVCIYRDEYGCLPKAICERQVNGECGWTKTPAYQICIKSLPSGNHNLSPQ
jgi:eight-cysteine-cluster-containing protein